MISLLIVLAVIITVILIMIGLYMVKTQVIINDRTYDALIWVINCLTMALPIVIAVIKALNCKYGALIVITLSGILAICNTAVNRSKANYKVKIEDGDADYRAVSSEDINKIMDNLTVIGSDEDGSHNCY